MAFFKVIRASAGSGKTFNLTREYLRLLFAEHDAFMHILAVTFTNKATEEMKSRIISELYALASDKSSKQLHGLMASSGLTEKQIRNKSIVILKKLLHRYSSFSVNTIDAFFQRIIRSFTRELGIQEGYTIELDTESVLTEILNQLMIMAESDKALLSWLTQFAESLIEKGESWNFRKSVRNLGKEIFKEEFKAINETSLKLFSDRNFLNQYKTELHGLIRKAESTSCDFGKKAESILNAHGLTVEDFSMKSRGPAGFLVKLKNCSFPELNVTAKQAAFAKEKWYTASSSNKSALIEVVVNELMPLMKMVVDFYQANYRPYFTATVILKNLYALGILIDLSKLADSWCSDNNAFLLPEAPVFLNKIIDGNDTPFIYEKAGCWYHHFMIDEFQDTSLMQWLNFKPLISNSLSQSYDNLAVGDTKQSIYRWRNSNWEILENRINQDFLPGIINEVTLKENWRSRSNIIQFNNLFFSSAASLLQGEFEQILNENSGTDIQGIQNITDLYRNMEQLAGNPSLTGGFVKVEYLANGEEDFYENANQKLVDLIYELLGKGYQLKDIAILTRKNSEAALLADFLLNTADQKSGKRLDVISDEALRLGSSVVVNSIIGFLQYIINPLDKTNNYFLLSVCFNYINKDQIPTVWINPGGRESSRNQAGFSVPEEFKTLALSPESFSLLEIAERIIKIFKLEYHSGEQVYLSAFRDMIIEYAKTHGSDISRFLDFWRETGHNKSVSAPSGQDAVRILTLHKSKGLEFKVTIIPYCNWELNTFKSFLWCKPNEAPFDKLPILPLSFTSQLGNTIFAEDFFKETNRQLIDNLNLLYVAFTRAQEALYVFCKDREEGSLKNVSDLTRKVLGKKMYILGEPPADLPTASPIPIESIVHKAVSLKDISNRVKIAFQGKLLIDPAVNKPSRPVNDGKILHEIFTFIKHRDDIKFAVTRLQIQGKIAAEDQNRYIRFIEYAMNDLQVSTWFTGQWKILNEAEIILPNGEIKRPDRVMTKDNQTIVIDYKFGTKVETKYQTQVTDYARLLKDMGYPGVNAYLWYVKLGRVVDLKTV